MGYGCRRKERCRRLDLTRSGGDGVGRTRPWYQARHSRKVGISGIFVHCKGASESDLRKAVEDASFESGEQEGTYCAKTYGSNVFYPNHACISGNSILLTRKDPETKDWRRILKEQFASGNGDVSNEAIDVLGLKGVLDLALNEPKLKKLYLPFDGVGDSEREGLAQALAEIAQRKDIKNIGLVIQINAEAEGMWELEASVIERIADNDVNYLFDFSGNGYISFGKTSCTNGMTYRELVRKWDT